MYQLQLKINKKGNWENTVYQPMELSKVQKILKHSEFFWGDVHDYRIVNVG